MIRGTCTRSCDLKGHGDSIIWNIWTELEVPATPVVRTEDWVGEGTDLPPEEVFSLVSMSDVTVRLPLSVSTCRNLPYFT